MSHARGRAAAALLPAAALGVSLAACTGPASTVAPPSAAPGARTPAVPAPEGDPFPPQARGTDPPEDPRGADPAVVALREYLLQQAIAVNARQSDPAALPAFTATLTASARTWALPLLEANLGDEMPGPYPVGVLGSTRTAGDRVELLLCLQDRGWQVDRATGLPLNAARYGRATAVVVRAGERWLVDDVAATGETCAADQVREERF
ncbi:hypothetical protein [Kineococcus esterisolvens]|uniref:hypothetical protein n=1 Tax=unclassified Kineococcus TaxID=2621656 RepID=UPI003D7DCD61